MYKRTEGIVLTTRTYAEADLIVSYLTKDYGIITVYAKSPRKVGSRFGSSLEPLTHSRIAFIGKEQSNLPRLIQSDIINSFQSLRESYNTFIKVSEAIRLTMRLIPEGQPVRMLFYFLLNTLRALERAPESRISIIYYKVKLLSLSGFSPMIDRCARCSGSADKFYFSEGSTLCAHCIDDSKEYMEITRALKNLYLFLLKSEPEVLNRVKIDYSLENRLEELITSHINYTVDIPVYNR
jgi:DNA repair protein RecO (recombination protein O)